MSTSIIPQLVKKDFMIMRKVILAFGLVSLACIGVTALLFGRIPELAFVNLAFILLASPAVTCGLVMLVQTIVFEKEKSTQAFIMSLPVTVKEFTLAKLLVNLAVFGAIWLGITGVAFYFAFARGLFPHGAIPFISMIFLGGFVAYIGIISVGLWCQSLGWTVLAIALCEMGTSAYLWVVAYLQPISAWMGGAEAVWNPTAVGIVSVQALVAVVLIAVTVFHQSRKRDFI